MTLTPISTTRTTTSSPETAAPRNRDRTRCACPGCRAPCRYLPGALAPDDLQYLIPAGADPLAWAAEHLRASPGAVVLTRRGREYVPSLVPARQADGMACHWLADDGLCAVHEDAPEGCASVDSHMPYEVAEVRSLARIRLIAGAWEDRSSLYATIWRHLERKGLTAPGPAESIRAAERKGLLVI